MKSRLLTLLAIAVLTVAKPSSAESARHLSREALRDRIRGAWAAQMIGVSYGAPTEFKTVGKIIEGDRKSVV